MKNIKAILAVLLAGCVMISFAACGSKEPAETTTAPEETVATDAAETPLAEPVIETTLADESTVADATTVADETTAAEATTVAEALTAPQDQAAILALYNDTVNDAFDAKVGFHKERVTDNEKMDAGIAFKTFKSLVYKFMGIGADNKYTEDVTKGKWESDAKKHYLRKSTLTAGDLTGAACKQSGSNLVVTLSVKNGSTKGSSNSKTGSTPIDKCGICVGNEDKGYYDHKTGPVIFDAIEGTFEKAVVNESYSGAKVVATIDAATGHLVSLKVEYNIKTSIDTGSIGAATATGTTHITYSAFKY
ncbi:MAG TPA: hypothetical protein DDY98_07330 [Ruminococcaceae bacterium]|nr:hypothetical protein [Oscillospiraceae bacterium]